MNKKELLPADQDPRNPSFSFKNMQNEKAFNNTQYTIIIIFNDNRS